MDRYPPISPLPEDRWCANCKRNVSPQRRFGTLQGAVYFAVLIFVGGIIGAIAQAVASTPGAFSINVDLRFGLIFGALVGLTLFVSAYVTDQLLCPICRTENLHAPR